MAETKNQSAQQLARRRLVKRRYVNSLDGLRSLAVLAVVAYHMRLSWMAGGLIGVTIVFVLSGYLMTMPGYLSESSFAILGRYACSVAEWPAITVFMPIWPSPTHT